MSLVTVISSREFILRMENVQDLAPSQSRSSTSLSSLSSISSISSQTTTTTTTSYQDARGESSDGSLASLTDAMADLELTAATSGGPDDKNPTEHRLTYNVPQPEHNTTPTIRPCTMGLHLSYLESPEEKDSDLEEPGDPEGFSATLPLTEISISVSLTKEVFILAAEEEEEEKGIEEVLQQKMAADIPEETPDVSDDDLTNDVEILLPTSGMLDEAVAVEGEGEESPVPHFDVPVPPLSSPSPSSPSPSISPDSLTDLNESVHHEPPQPTSQANAMPAVADPVAAPVIQSTDQAKFKPISQSTNHSTNQLTKQSISQATNQSINQLTSRSANQSANRSINQSSSRSTAQSTNQSTNQSTDRSINQSTIQSSSRSTAQSTNRSGSQSTNQPKRPSSSVCLLCDKGPYASLTEQDHHFRDKHRGVRCYLCKIPCYTAVAVKHHAVQHSVGVKWWRPVCAVCKVGFESNVELANHGKRCGNKALPWHLKRLGERASTRMRYMR